MSLMEKMLAIKTKSQVNILTESFEDKDIIQTELPILNVAFSGKLDGGFVSGITVFGGESKSFKTALSLYCLKAYLNKYPEAVAVFYDTEWGTTLEYWNSFGIDTSRVLHIQIMDVEELKFDAIKRLNEIKKGDKVFFFIDSLGAIASRKEIEDAVNEKSVADMSRAKQIKSLLRMITPHFSMKDIPCVIVNHVYKSMDLFPKTIMSGGSAPTYVSNQVFFISKSQEKDGDDLIGWNFTILIEKSRFVKERSKLVFTVLNNKGIKQWSGLFELALESGMVFSPSKGWYSTIDLESGEVNEKKFRARDIDNMEFWKPFLKNEKFKEFVENKFKLSMNQ